MLNSENNTNILHSNHRGKCKKCFWINLQKYIEKQIKVSKNPIKFNNFKFPKFEKDYIYNPEEPIEEATNFYLEHYDENGNGFTNKVIEKCHIEFNHCTFLDEVNLKRYNFKESIIFKDCTFENQVCLNDTIDARIEFKDCKFNTKKFDLSNKIFNENFAFIDCKNIANLNLENTVFKKTASFSESKLKDIILDETYFEGICIFVKTHFLDDLKFDYCTFEENVFFNDAKIHKTIDTKHAILKKEVTFLDIKNQDGNGLTSLNIANRETARIIKHSFEKQDNIIEANKFYALEMQKREEKLNDKKSNEYNFWEQLVFKIHGISSNHSQDWVLALFWIINITFLYSNIQYQLCYEESLFILVPYITILSIFFCIESMLIFEIKLRNIGIVLMTIIHYFIYVVITTYFNLDFFSNNLNPFSIITIEKITFITLLYKLIITYLIYQFIISIRQNTRRK